MKKFLMMVVRNMMLKRDSFIIVIVNGFDINFFGRIVEFVVEFKELFIVVESLNFMLIDFSGFLLFLDVCW